jgi:hypothetical protein
MLLRETGSPCPLFPTCCPCLGPLDLPKCTPSSPPSADWLTLSSNSHSVTVSDGSVGGSPGAFCGKFSKYQTRGKNAVRQQTGRLRCPAAVATRWRASYSAEVQVTHISDKNTSTARESEVGTKFTPVDMCGALDGDGAATAARNICQEVGPCLHAPIPV